VIRDRGLIEYAEGIISSGVSGPIGWTDIHRLVRRLLVALKEEMNAGFAVSAQLSQERAELEATIKDLREKLEVATRIAARLPIPSAPAVTPSEQAMNYVIRRSPTSTSYWREDALTAEWTTRTFATVFGDNQSDLIVAKFREHFAPDALRRPADQSPAPPPADNAPPPADIQAGIFNLIAKGYRLGVEAMVRLSKKHELESINEIEKRAMTETIDGHSPAPEDSPPADNKERYGIWFLNSKSWFLDVDSVPYKAMTWSSKEVASSFATTIIAGFLDYEVRPYTGDPSNTSPAPEDPTDIINSVRYRRDPPPTDKAASPITAPEAASPAEESKVDELIREAEAAITGGASVARPLPILIAKLLRELKGQRATCLLQRIVLKDLRAKLAQMPKEERWGIWFSNTKSWFLDYSDMAGGAQIMTWSSKGAAVSFAKQSQLAPPYVIRPYNPSAPAPEDAIPAAPKAPEAAGPAASKAPEETYTFSLKIAQLFLSPGTIYDRLYALDVEGRAWSIDIGSKEASEWRKLPPLKESKP